MGGGWILWRGDKLDAAAGSGWIPQKGEEWMQSAGKFKARIPPHEVDDAVETRTVT